MPCGDSGAFLEALRMGGLSWGRRQWGCWGQERERVLHQKGSKFKSPKRVGFWRINEKVVVRGDRGASGAGDE